jgi:hypothetical protein
VFTAPVDVGRLRLPPLGLVILAGIGALLLLVVAAGWPTPSDEHAYWLAARRLLDGQPLYDPTATTVTPYAYWYPPIVAQVLMPVAAVLPSLVFTGLWTVLMLGCLFYLSDRRILVALALVVFLPVAVEFGFRNVHLVLAALVVLAIRRWPVLFAVGAAIKISPALGIVYLAARGRWRDVAIVSGVGFAMLVVSVALAPDAWRQFVDILLARGPGDASGFLPIPYVARAAVGLVLAFAAGRLRPSIGDPLLVVAVTIALPTLWFTALSLLIGVVPLVSPGRAEQARERPAASRRRPAPQAS